MKSKIVDKDSNLPRIQSTMVDHINVSEDYMNIYDIQKECLKELLGDCEIGQRNGNYEGGGLSSLDFDVFESTTEIESQRGILRVIRNEDKTVNICFKGKVEE
ncbi:hypothetical protein F0310_04225 (plasmid) [Borrelia sp. A-FGy1]|uniref:hypothetical protein n=1 Tax=Borrelia sp. A-FGy1 TaxID=2608247 RepID=UPI0015F6339B|nr:hypothetical protein [Borrelia sp. A-FGy1]QMU99624.1 hypothetical protein F0310_04225 [Borrelia sp. A-FGy1]